MRFQKRSNSHIIDFLFALSLFCVFALCAFIVVAIGAEVYRSTVQHMNDTYSTRTALSYVVEKLRQHDEDGLISIGEVDGETAFILKDEEEGVNYVTYIYSDDNRILELTTQEETEVSADMGQEIIEVNDFAITKEGYGFFRLSAKDTRGNTTSLYVHLKNSGGYEAEAS